jgi:tRNA (cmo5U34)-methyltransferase
MPSGVFIFCEKEYTTSANIQEAFTFTNYDNKRKHFTDKEILDKEVKLREIMHPLHSKDNIAMLKKAGFTSVETFFQSMNFKGYICNK